MVGGLRFLRALFVSLLLGLAGPAALVGCGGGSGEPPGPTVGTEPTDNQDDPAEQDASEKDDTSAPSDRTEPQTLPSAQDSEDPCTFNADCIATERCECDLDSGCACRIGERGTGQAGIDTCTDGNDCATALCLEGPGDVYYCSGPCGRPSDCEAALPLCADIAMVGRICVRDPNG